MRAVCIQECPFFNAEVCKLKLSHCRSRLVLPGGEEIGEGDIEFLPILANDGTSLSAVWGALDTLMLLRGEQCNPSTCVATAWAGWPCATRASMMICLVVPPTCTVFGTTMQPAGDGDAVLVLHLMLKQSIIWPEAHCAPVGFPCSRNNISSYVADNCANAGLQRGSDGVGVAVDPNKDLYDWPRRSRSVPDLRCHVHTRCVLVQGSGLHAGLHIWQPQDLPRSAICAPLTV